MKLLQFNILTFCVGKLSSCFQFWSWVFIFSDCWIFWGNRLIYIYILCNLIEKPSFLIWWPPGVLNSTSYQLWPAWPMMREHIAVKTYSELPSLKESGIVFMSYNNHIIFNLEHSKFLLFKTQKHHNSKWISEGYVSFYR